jgi:hypothetical protein
LLNDTGASPGVLSQLPHLLDGESNYIVLAEGYKPSPADVRKIRSMGIQLAKPPSHPPFVLEAVPEGVLASSRQRPERAVLTESEIAECAAEGFKSDFLISVTGQRGKRGGNQVIFGGRELFVPDREFRLFVCLVLFLQRRKDGYVSFDELRSGDFSEEADRLVSESEVAPQGLSQAIDRLRDRFKGVLGDLPARQFIERTSNRLRLSTHKICVTVDAPKIAAHEDPVIARLGRALSNYISEQSQGPV